MRGVTKRKKVIISLAMASIIILSLVIGSMFEFFDRKVNRDNLVEKLKMINAECNSVYENVDESERKYIELLEEETDPFMIGMYSSALVQVYTVRNDYENIVKYSNQAVSNYRKVDGGIYFAIPEQKYLAWSMLSIGKYADSFSATNSLFEMTKGSGNEVLTKYESTETEALIYSIFIFIYSQFNLVDRAELYYNKLNDIEVTQELEHSMGDKIAYSKLVYADKINDLDLIKKYSDECYRIALDRDMRLDTNISDSVILNVGHANIRLGNYDEGLEQVKKAEKFYLDMNDRRGLGTTYVVYGDYYVLINEINKAQEFYDKAMDMYASIGDDYNLKEVANMSIKVFKEHNMEEEANKYYKAYYDTSDTIGGDEGINTLLAEVVDINDELSQSKLTTLEKQRKTDRISGGIACVVIVILGILITRMYSLIKKKNESEKRLEEIANTDYLTGVNTRSYGEKLILDEIYKNTQFSMAIIDIDNFKCINDTYGHTFGDSILKIIAKQLKKNLDNTDILARYGGEEFIISFLNKDKQEAKKKLDEIRTIINSIEFENGIRISFSGGIQDWDKSGINEIIKRADELLYEAKKSGKNQIII